MTQLNTMGIVGSEARNAETAQINPKVRDLASQITSCYQKYTRLPENSSARKANYDQALRLIHLLPDSPSKERLYGLFGVKSADLNLEYLGAENSDRNSLDNSTMSLIQEIRRFNPHFGTCVEQESENEKEIGQIFKSKAYRTCHGAI